jgi:hypothetical protein
LLRLACSIARLFVSYGRMLQLTFALSRRGEEAEKAENEIHKGGERGEANDQHAFPTTYSFIRSDLRNFINTSTSPRICSSHGRTTGRLDGWSDRARVDAHGAGL